jgi:hypothetical protein
MKKISSFFKPYQPVQQGKYSAPQAKNKANRKNQGFISDLSFFLV